MHWHIGATKLRNSSKLNWRLLGAPDSLDRDANPRILKDAEPFILVRCKVIIFCLDFHETIIIGGPKEEVRETA